MIWNAPVFLFGLFGILVPIAIHLWSKKNRSPIPFGSLQFITDASTRSLRQILPTDLALLTLRILIIIIVTFILTDLRISSLTSSPKRAIFIDPIYLGEPGVKTLFDSLSKEPNVFWLSNGFPPLSERLPEGSRASLPTLAQVQKNSLVVSPLSAQLLPEQIDQLQTIQFAQWPISDKESSLGSIRGGKQIVGTFSEDHIKFRYPEQTSNKDTLLTTTYALVSDEHHNEQIKWITTAIEAIQKQGVYQLQKADRNNATWLIWMSAEPSPAHAKKISSSFDQVRLLKKYSDEHYAIKSNFGLQEAIQQQLTGQLYHILNPADAQIKQEDKTRPNAPSLYASTSPSAEETSANDLRNYWWGLLVCLFLLERIIALR